SYPARPVSRNLVASWAGAGWRFGCGASRDLEQDRIGSSQRGRSLVATDRNPRSPLPAPPPPNRYARTPPLPPPPPSAAHHRATDRSGALAARLHRPPRTPRPPSLTLRPPAHSHDAGRRVQAGQRPPARALNAAPHAPTHHPRRPRRPPRTGHPELPLDPPARRRRRRGRPGRRRDADARNPTGPAVARSQGDVPRWVRAVPAPGAS